MIARIFDKINLRSLLIFFLLSFLIILFINLCKSGGSFSYDKLISSILFCSFFVFVIYLFIKLGDRVSSNIFFKGIHLISFPIVWLFYPHGPGLVTQKIFIGILLICLKYNFIQAIHSNKNVSNIFYYSLITSVLIKFNDIFVLFHLLSIWIFLNRNYYDIKYLLGLLIPIIFVPSIFYLINLFLPPSAILVFDNAININIIDFNSQLNRNWIWFGLILIAVWVTIFRRPSRKIFINSPDHESRFIFMSFWFYLSVLIGILGLQIGEGRWLLSFIPIAYFFGIFLENIKSDYTKDFIIVFSILGMMLFKLIDFNIILI